MEQKLFTVNITFIHLNNSLTTFISYNQYQVIRVRFAVHTCKLQQHGMTHLWERCSEENISLWRFSQDARRNTVDLKTVKYTHTCTCTHVILFIRYSKDEMLKREQLLGPRRTMKVTRLLNLELGVMKLKMWPWIFFFFTKKYLIARVENAAHKFWSSPPFTVWKMFNIEMKDAIRNFRMDICYLH